MKHFTKMSEFIKMSLLGILKPLQAYLAFDKYSIESFVFSINTKISFCFVAVCSLLVTASQYLGDPIDCLVDRTVPSAVMDTYCWIHSTFTLPHRVEGSAKDPHGHPGLGPVAYGEATTQHKYYQWVCFTLFFQSLCFLAPRLLWKEWEAGQIAKLIPEDLFYNVTDPRMPKFPKPPGAIDQDIIRQGVRTIREYLTSMFSIRGVYKHQRYFFRYLVCEFLSFINIIFQLLLIDTFLGGMFSTYGPMVWEISSMDPEDRSDPMNLVFPKVAKCTFYKYGATATIEQYDGLCVLPLNILNEKIYIFLWFWLIFLVILTSFNLLFFTTTLISDQIRGKLLQKKSHDLVPFDMAMRLVRNVRRGEWFFLWQLGSNLHPHVFSELCVELDKKLTERSLPPESVGATTTMANGSAISDNYEEKIELAKLS